MFHSYSVNTHFIADFVNPFTNIIPNHLQLNFFDFIMSNQKYLKRCLYGPRHFHQLTIFFFLLLKEALKGLKKNLQNKWHFITMQAEEQVRLAKDRKKEDKIVSDSQERAYWRLYRPPPGYSSCLESIPVPHRNRGTWQKKKTIEDQKKEVSICSYNEIFGERRSKTYLFF